MSKKFSDQYSKKYAVRKYNPVKDCWEWQGVYLTKPEIAKLYRNMVHGKVERELLDFVEISEDQ